MREKRQQPSRSTRSAILSLIMLAGMLTLSPATSSAVEPGRVLILNGTVSGGLSSIEASEAVALGLTVDVVDNATWSGMTAAQFAGYQAIILGDPTCEGIDADVTTVEANANIWGPVINGNIVIIGSDPVFHAYQGGTLLTRRGVDFAAAKPGKTGAYITLSCYYHGTAAGTPIPMLDGLGGGGFTMTGVGCYNNAHIVAEHPALSGLADATLSNWSCSVHEAFQAWPGAFVPLAIAQDFDSSFTASDGSQGPPYILAGGDIRSFPLSLNPLSGSQPAGTAHVVVAQLLDGITHAPVIGAKIGFRITSGPNAGNAGECDPGCITNLDGRVGFGYTSNGAAGTDTIQSFYDMNNNGTPDLGEPQTTAGMTWTIPAKTLIGLGDSIAAGHGLGPSGGFPDNAKAYPMLTAAKLGYTGRDYAISGACAATAGKPDAAPGTPSSCTTSVLVDELPNVSGIPNVITMTVGANDIRFGDCFRAVVLITGDNPCKGNTFASNLQALSANLGTLLGQIKTKFPNVPIYLMKYYDPLPGTAVSNDQICPSSTAIAFWRSKNRTGYVQAYLERNLGFVDVEAASVQDDMWLDAETILGKLNATITKAAAAAGAHMVSLDFSGHDFCRPLTGGTVADTWVYGPTIHGYVQGTGLIDTTVRIDLDVPGVCPSPHPEDSLAYRFADSGKWDHEKWKYDFTGKINCLPHPTIDGQKAIAKAFAGAITGP